MLKFQFNNYVFQEEDGIRDLYVTGVQTCALPISRRNGRSDRHWANASAGSCRAPTGCRRDRKSVVEGKSVDLGGRRIIKKTEETARGGSWLSPVDTRPLWARAGLHTT